MITLKDKQTIILKHYHDGKSQRAIHRETGIDRKTVSKYIKEYEANKAELLNGKDQSDELVQSIVEKPKYDTSNRSKVKLTEEVLDLIKYHIQENEVKRKSGRKKQRKKKIDIYEALLKEGFSIGYTTVCNAIRTLEKEFKEAYIKQSYSPGQVCEFDWGDVKLTIDGKPLTLQLAVFTSAFGNYRFAVLFYNQKTESFLEAHKAFFEHLKGSYHQLVYDNTRVAVKRFVGPSEKEPTESLLKLSLYYGFDFRFCNAESGWEKGHVERSVEYVRRKAFSFQDEFESILKAQEYLDKVCEQLNSRPQAANNNKSALEILEGEKGFLLPHFPPYDTARTAELRVDKYSTVCIDNCHYSVPDRYVGEFIFAKIYPKHIQLECIRFAGHGERFYN